MGHFRFRRSIRILRWLRLNIGKRGVSTSIGVKGAYVTLGHGHARETAGIPGSGLSYTHVDKTDEEAPGEAQPRADRQHVSEVKLLVLAALVGMLADLVEHLV